MIKHAWMGVAVLLVAVSASGQEPAPSPLNPYSAAQRTDESQLSRFIADRRDPHGRRCELRAMVSSGNVRYLACGEAGVWTVRVTPGRAIELIDLRPTAGLAGGFFVRDGMLWVETTSVSADRLAPVAADATIQNNLLPTAEAVGGTAAVPPPSAAAAPAPELSVPEPTPAPAAQPQPQLRAATEPPPVSGKLIYHELAPADARVVKLEPGFAIIDMGSEHGVASDDHVSFEETTRERVDDDNMAEHSQRVAVGNATTIGRERSKVQLGIDERVRVGATARPTRDPVTSTSFSPQRLGEVWDASFIARPFLVVDNLGAGGLVEARVGYRWEIPLHVEALLLPAALATGREHAIGAVAGIVTASFDSRLFEVGLGAGAQTVNDPSFDLRSGSGTSFAQRLRIGSVDGGMIEAFSYIVLFHSQFEFSDLQVHAQLPVGDRTWLVANAGGGMLGAGHGELGLRVLLNGNGDRGSFFITATVGGVHVFRSRFCSAQEFNCGSIDYTGPLAGVGGDWRF